MKLLNRLFLILSVTISIGLFFSCNSCSNKTQERIFQEALAYIDAYIAQGKDAQALNSLSKLYKKAKTSSNFLSIVKRLLKLNSALEAIITLERGIKAVPESSELKATLISILIDQNKANDAFDYCIDIDNNAFLSICAEASVLADKKEEIPDGALKAAYVCTNDQVFLKNEALFQAVKGKLKKAIELNSLIEKDKEPSDPFFWSRLYFDLGIFEPIFKYLPFSLAKADRSGSQGKNEDFACGHLMLAADAAFTQGDTEKARAFWQATLDRTNTGMPIIFYNMAITAPDDDDRTNLLLECIDSYPNYYPIIAHYTREYLALHNGANKDDITRYLEDRGFYSMEMERTYFKSPKMRYKPDDLLEQAIKNKNSDIRFILEKFRYNRIKDISSSARQRGNSEMWKLLEKHGDNPTVCDYAKWYFSKLKDFNSCFSVGKTGNIANDSFYKAIAEAMEGDFDQAIIDFTTACTEKRNAYAATANTAYIYYLQGKTDMAIETFTLASSMTQDKIKQSRLYYEIALILSERKAFERARNALSYAVELNPQNYQAESLLKRLNATK